jgi:hypothetical protein
MPVAVLPFADDRNVRRTHNRVPIAAIDRVKTGHVQQSRLILEVEENHALSAWGGRKTQPNRIAHDDRLSTVGKALCLCGRDSSFRGDAFSLKSHQMPRDIQSKVLPLENGLFNLREVLDACIEFGLDKFDPKGVFAQRGLGEGLRFRDRPEHGAPVWANG